jgi:hypothetical protein
MLLAQDTDEKKGLMYPVWLATLMARYALDHPLQCAAAVARGSPPVDNVASFAHHMAALLSSSLPASTEERYALEALVHASSDGTDSSSNSSSTQCSYHSSSTSSGGASVVSVALLSVTAEQHHSHSKSSSSTAGDHHHSSSGHTHHHHHHHHHNGHNSSHQHSSSASVTSSSLTQGRPRRYWTRRLWSFLRSMSELKGVQGRDAKALERLLQTPSRAAQQQQQQQLHHSAAL